MHRLSVPVATLFGLAILILALFSPVLFRGEQFGYRDAEQYYYPLHKRTVDQWKSGHLPLWDSGENGGMTLIGNPTAAVLYPGKIVFAIFPYPLAARLYLIGHVVLAFAAMTVTMRKLGITPTGSVLGGLSYGFGGPVVFQCCNAIYLVGAAWLPLGFLAADFWLRKSNRKGIAGLAAVLAMLCLGGDIQAAYLLGFFSAAYALWLSFGERFRLPSWKVFFGGTFAWILATLVLAAWLPSMISDGISPTIARWAGRGIKFGILGGFGWLTWKLLGSRRTMLARSWGGLIVSAFIGAAIAGAQLVPVAELASQSFRMSDDNRMDVYGFSVEPYRLIEMAFPGIFGLEYPENRLWLLAIPPIASHALWTASLYVGVVTLLLMFAALGGKEAPKWRGPTIVMTVVALILSFGRFGGPLWWARYMAPIASKLGPHGPSGSFFFRSNDGFVRDAFGTAYWAFASLAPGFDGFRFPAKFLPFATFGISALAALGWEQLANGGGRRAMTAAKCVVVLGSIGLLATALGQSTLLSWWEKSKMVPSLGGPIDSLGALWELRRSLIHGTTLAVISIFLFLAASKGRRWAGPLAVCFLAVDLSIAQSRILWTVPQSEFERPSQAAEAIAKSEAKTPGTSPFRIARLPEWHPISWIRTRSPDRLREIVAWERDTLQSGHGTILGYSYTLTPGVLEPEVFVDLFQPWTVEVSSNAARIFGLSVGQPIRYFPRRAFDLWGARYFVVPVVPDDWLDPNRAIASFLLNTEPLVPDPRPEGASKEWRETEDWQLLRNPAAWPRAWVVHDVLYRTESIETDTDASRALKKSLLYQADPVWTLEGRQVEDPRTTAWVETTDPKLVGLQVDGLPPSRSETVEVVKDRPGHVEIRARLERDGLIVVADSFAPGWIARLDGVEVPIWRTNRAMRGVAMTKGGHQLVFDYEPRSVQIGLAFSSVGLIGLIGMWLVSRRRPLE